VVEAARAVSSAGRRGGTREIARFLEIQNVGLNVPFALAFVVVAAGGLPALVPFALIVIAFVGARNAGHAFNRWVDRRLDAANPRTADRALVTGRLSGGFALGVTALSSGVVVAAAAFLNPVALALSPVALALVLGYSYTKRVSWLSTAFLGLVESITPAAAFVGLEGRLPPIALLAVGGVFAWGTAFEMIHSLGDLASDRALGLRSIPVRFGRRASLILVGTLHGAALGLLAAFGWAEGLRWPFYVAVAGIAVGIGLVDRGLATGRGTSTAAFRWHVVFALVFLGGVASAVFVR
jgi:4-hydroxybenzoate polyprenyltransferase